jgi:serine protease
LVSDQSLDERFYRAHVDPDRRDAILAALAARPEVEIAEPDAEMSIIGEEAKWEGFPNDPLYKHQWHLRQIGAPEAWKLADGKGVIVAVIDTGVAFEDHKKFHRVPDLANTKFAKGYDFVNNNAHANDDHGHGTHVAGTIGQLTNNSVGVAGMAFNVRIMPVKVIDTDWDIIFNSPFRGTDDVVARGVRYAVDNGAKVLNMSIGRTGPPAPVIQEAIQYAVSQGAFVVVAAGNEFLDGNPTPRPADIAPLVDGMVAVGAVGRDRVRARYSSTGSFVELAAPGGDTSRGGTEAGILQQTFDFDLTETFLQGVSRFRAPRFDAFAYQFFQGTSMAAPHVSGFAALLMQQGITNPAAIEAIMKRYSTDLGTPGRDNEYGHGLINPRAALRGMGLAR